MKTIPQYLSDNDFAIPINCLGVQVSSSNPGHGTNVVSGRGGCCLYSIIHSWGLIFIDKRKCKKEWIVQSALVGKEEGKRWSFYCRNMKVIG